MADTINIAISEQSISVTVSGGATWDSLTGKPTATAENDFIVADENLSWVKRTLAQVKTILGLGSAAYTNSTAYMPVQAAFQTSNWDSGTLTLDATTYKDWKISVFITAETINISNATDGDAGMLVLDIQNISGATVTLGAAFTVKLGSTSFVGTFEKKNIISWRKVGTDIYYTIIQNA